MAYYQRYDAHYQSLYEQGIDLWSNGPDHCAENIAKVCSFLRQHVPRPQGKKLLDVGCGEGHLAQALAEMGFCYTGVDCSPHALAKARARVDQQAAISFISMDILQPEPPWLRQRFDIVLDQSCLPMLVVDQDRARYLRIIGEILAEDGLFYLSNQARDETAYAGPIPSFAAFAQHFQCDLSQNKRWQAWNGEQWVWLELPRFAGRPQSRRGYLGEFAAAGFAVAAVMEEAEWGLDFKLVRAESHS